MATFELYSYRTSHRLMSLDAGITSKTYPMSVVVKNISSYTIRRLLMQIVVKKEELGYAESGKLVLANIVGSGTTPAAVTIDPGDRKGPLNSVSARVTREMLSAMTAAGIRSAQVYVYTKATSASLGFPEEYIPIPNHFILNTYAAPVISDFSLARGTNGREDDEGINLLTTLKLGCAPDTLTSGMSIRLHYAQNADADANSPYIDLSAHVDALIAGVENAPDLISQTFSNGHDWGFYLTFGDEFESVSASAQIFKAFANLHLSGVPTGGACFGGFSKSQAGKPMLESHYRFYPYNGIEGVNIFRAEEIKTGGLWLDRKPIYQQSFVGTISKNATTEVIGNLPEDWESVISVNGVLRSANSNTFINGNYWYSTSLYVRLWVDSGEVRVYTAGNTYVGRTMYATIYYTKTSDDPVEDYVQSVALEDSEGYALEDSEGYALLALTDVSDDSEKKTLNFKASEIDKALTLANSSLQKTGGIMMGPLELYGDPTSDMEAATKQYADNILPKTTESDNGKVMMVVEGKWAAADLPKYDGEYSVTPAAEEQTLLTERKYLDTNLKIEKIPYSEVSNTANGTTVTIG